MVPKIAGALLSTVGALLLLAGAGMGALSLMLAGSYRAFLVMGALPIMIGLALVWSGIWLLRGAASGRAIAEADSVGTIARSATLAARTANALMVIVGVAVALAGGALLVFFNTGAKLSLGQFLFTLPFGVIPIIVGIVLAFNGFAAGEVRRKAT